MSLFSSGVSSPANSQGKMSKQSGALFFGKLLRYAWALNSKRCLCFCPKISLEGSFEDGFALAHHCKHAILNFYHQYIYNSYYTIPNTDHHYYHISCRMARTGLRWPTIAGRWSWVSDFTPSTALLRWLYNYKYKKLNQRQNQTQTANIRILPPARRSQSNQQRHRRIQRRIQTQTKPQIKDFIYHLLIDQYVDQ